MLDLLFLILFTWHCDFTPSSVDRCHRAPPPPPAPMERAEAA